MASVHNSFSAYRNGLVSQYYNSCFSYFYFKPYSKLNLRPTGNQIDLKIRTVAQLLEPTSNKIQHRCDIRNKESERGSTSNIMEGPTQSWADSRVMVSISFSIRGTSTTSTAAHQICHLQRQTTVQVRILTSFIRTRSTCNSITSKDLTPWKPSTVRRSSRTSVTQGTTSEES